MHHVPRALEIFEVEYVPAIARAFAQVDASVSFKEEMRARVRGELLSGRLSQYNGRGPLKGWIRVVAIREALLALRKSSKEVPADDARLDERAAGDDQELAHLKRLYRGEFSEAFRAALAVLESRDRNLLRHHHLDGLTIDDLARMYGAHRATTARWLNRVREKLLQETRAQLTSRLKVDEAELESIMRLIDSDLDVSFRSLL